MYRRDLLAMTAASLGMIGVAGCLGSDSTADDGGTPTRSAPSATPTRAPSTSTDGGGTPTRTPVPFPDACQPLPDVDGLPARPPELTAESVRSYVTEFERVYAVATRSEYGGIANLRVIESETLGERYRLLLEVEGAPATTTGPDGSTPTPMPIDAYVHKVRYRLKGDRMLRELLTYPDEATLSSDCWILSSPET